MTQRRICSSCGTALVKMGYRVYSEMGYVPAKDESSCDACGENLIQSILEKQDDYWVGTNFESSPAERAADAAWERFKP